jgi:hypothetical protein
MDRRQFVRNTFLGLFGIGSVGCRSKQFAEVRKPGEADMVGSHAAGAETFKPLVEEATSKLLGRHCSQNIPVGTLPPPPMRICFVGVENRSAEEIGDFKDQLYQTIDMRILDSHVFQCVNKRFVDAGLMQTRLRPDQLFLPENMRQFVAVMEGQGQPFDYLLSATVTSGTTHENKDTQRDYLLTLEMINVRTGEYDKQAAELSKGYHHSRVGRFWGIGPLQR